jgi:glycosyltransferase involved in cell wall biosynthesis
MRELGQTLRVLLRTRATTTLVSLPYPEGSPGAVLAAAWLPGPSMVTVHLVPDGFQYTRLRRALYRLATATSQRWVTPSEDCRARLATALGCEVARIERIYHGVELGPDPARPARQADRDAARRALGLPCDAVILLSVARLTHQKGYDVLAAAIPAVALHDPRALWVWVGDGDRRSELTEQLGSLGVGDRVMLLGDRDDVRRLLAAADLFVLPTRYEAFGLAVLEAMAAGVPIIATDVGSLREIVTDDVHARLVPPEDPAALSAAMAWAIAHPVEMRALAVTAHARARTSFRPEGMIVETLAALEPGGAPQRALS